ncbi:dihydrolipoamide acetyltransferase family protein [Leisingera daeponensis]|uniref:dihydrolipoamide acetyltransferase family protein n=1 Tax=Leisingera daeponensis TaxID=405746 RepID=UPI000426F110|nr:dihydrolipoamide acetyltransferase family protein [Leisingera daeponensis]
MALKRFVLPDLGEGLEEAELLEWHAAPGDRVVAEQPLVSVETDKAVVEIPAPWPGTLVKQFVQPGSLIQVGAPLADFDTGARPDRGAVVGDLNAAAASQSETLAAPAPAAAGPAGRVRPPPPRAMPAARALAARHGLALSGVAGSGPGGTITRADVEALIPPEEGELLSEQRRAMARRMAEAGAQVVPATLHDQAAVTAWTGPGVLLRLVRAAAAAAAAEPALNAWYDAGTQIRELHRTVDLGIAVDTAAGLYVPVLRDAGQTDTAALQREVQRLTGAARQRRLQAADQAGATLTLSNFGPLGGRHATLVVRPPQVAILGAGRIFDAAAWGPEGPERQRVLPLSLTFDHRAVTGGEAARFLAAAIADLERPD